MFEVWFLFQIALSAWNVEDSICFIVHKVKSKSIVRITRSKKSNDYDYKASNASIWTKSIAEQDNRYLCFQILQAPNYFYDYQRARKNAVCCSHL